MKKVFMLALLAGLSLSARAQTAPPQGAAESEPRTTVLYAPNKYQHDLSRASLSFMTGAISGGGDLYYGTLYVSEEHDWFQVAVGRDDRTAFRDLGEHGWGDAFEVPVVEPFPKLKEGEQRSVTVDASGKDGEDGAPGAPAADADGVVRQHPPSAAKPLTEPRRPKHDGVPKVDPIFAKAVAGHMYVLHVVDEREDFYVLFRVESLVRGDNCTITWKRIPAPPAESAGRK
ncbi:MAG TPA: hypothetical protein VF588_05225 [Pyrinomonadaceae bacterium]